MRAHLYDANVRFIARIVDRDLCHTLYPILYGGSHVGNNLHDEGVVQRVAVYYWLNPTWTVLPK
jgi:hypothetical protein